MTQQKQYDKEFKLHTVQLVWELGISSKTLYGRVAQYKEDPKHAFVGSGYLKPDDKDLRNMQKRIRDLDEENAILKKAMRINTFDRK